MDGRYILEGHEPVPVDDFDQWAVWYESADRRVALTDIAPNYRVSTVFLGRDHQLGSGPPLLFETLVFHDGMGDDERLCSTWAEAEEQHKSVCAELQGKAAV